MQYTMKEVYYDVYCTQCVHAKVSEEDSPCNECLTQGWNENSHKPIKYEADTDRLKNKISVTKKIQSMLGRKKR